MVNLNAGILGKGLTLKEAKRKASEVYEKTTDKKVGGGGKLGAYIFFGSIALLFVIFIIKLFISKL